MATPKQIYRQIYRVLSKRFKASSLVEVLVAVAVCMLVFSLSMMILLKTDRENNSRLKLEADLVQENLNQEVLSLGEDTIRSGGLVISRSIEEYSGNALLWQVTYRVHSKNGTPLAVKKILVSAKTEMDEE